MWVLILFILGWLNVSGTEMSYPACMARYSEISMEREREELNENENPDEEDEAPSRVWMHYDFPTNRCYIIGY